MHCGISRVWLWLVFGPCTMPPKFETERELGRRGTKRGGKGGNPIGVHSMDSGHDEAQHHLVQKLRMHRSPLRSGGLDHG